MVRSIHKTKMAFSIVLATAASVAMAGSAYAENPQNLDFQVNVAEVLTISITNPTAWASGNLNNYNSTTGLYESDLLRNKVTVSGTTNNPVGFTVSMYAYNTNLENTVTATSIPTLSEVSTAGNFPVNRWGYSVEDTAAGSNSAPYRALTTRANPVVLIDTHDSADTRTGAQDIYFGAKADSSKASGTYAQTVYFAAVTGTIDTDNPIIPNQPATDGQTLGTAEYHPSSNPNNPGHTTYTTRTTDTTAGTTTTTTQVSSGDVRSAYQPAAGVTTAAATGTNNTGIATALGVAAAAAAVSGGVLFYLAKRNSDIE